MKASVVVFVLLFGAFAHAEERTTVDLPTYDPAGDKGFGLSEADFVRKLNQDRLLRPLGVKVKIAGRELAEDEKREVLDYDFGGCPRAVGSVDRYTKNVLSFTLVANHDCVRRRGDRSLFVVYAASIALGLAREPKEAIGLVRKVLEASDTNPTDKTRMRSGSASANGRTLQIIGPPSDAGLIFKIYPTEGNSEPLVSTREDQKPNFGQTAREMRAKINERLTADGADSFKKCADLQKLVICSFDDNQFQKLVQGFKKLDLANGKFKLYEAVFLIPANGNLERIRLLGTRESPAALFHFIGTLGSVIRSLDPSIDNHQSAETILDLGIMRGDDDASIGTEKIIIKKGFAASCIQYLSNESMKIDCNFVPRT